MCVDTCRFMTFGAPAWVNTMLALSAGRHGPCRPVLKKCRLPRGSLRVRTHLVGRLGSGLCLVGRLGSRVRVSAILQKNARIVGRLGSGPHLVGRLGSRVRVSAILQKNVRFVGWLGSGPRLVDRLGSRVWVSAILQ